MHRARCVLEVALRPPPRHHSGWPDLLSCWQGPTQRPASETDPLELGGCKTSLLPRLGNRPPSASAPAAGVVQMTGQEERQLGRWASSFGILLIFCF